VWWQPERRPEREDGLRQPTVSPTNAASDGISPRRRSHYRAATPAPARPGRAVRPAARLQEAPRRPPPLAQITTHALAAAPSGAQSRAATDRRAEESPDDADWPGVRNRLAPPGRPDGPTFRRVPSRLDALAGPRTWAPPRSGRADRPILFYWDHI
jgi:hypothetical protein